MQQGKIQSQIYKQYFIFVNFYLNIGYINHYILSKI